MKKKQIGEIESRRKFLSQKVYKDWDNYVYMKKSICIKLFKKFSKIDKDKKTAK